MNQLSTYLVLISCWLFLLPVGAQEPSLSYHLQAGEKYMIDVDIQQNTYSESMNSEEISLYSRTKMEFQVDSIDTMHRIHMRVRYRDLLLSMLAPELNIDLNSGSENNKMLRDMVDSLEMGTFHMVLKATGELHSVKGLAPRFQTLAAFSPSDSSKYQVILSTLMEVYGPDSFQSLINLFLSIYPVMESMTNWTHDFIYYFNTKPVKMMNRYNLTRSTEEELTIQGIGMLNAMKEFQEETSMGKVKSTVSGSQTYDFHMDRETGWINRCVSRQRLMIETTILRSSYLPTGLKIPSYTETVFEVKGSRLN